MTTYRIEATLTEDQTITLRDLPFPAGTAVEIIVVERALVPSLDPLSLRGTPINYIDPTAPVAQDDWEVLK
jgi:hypothetical protein